VEHFYVKFGDSSCIVSLRYREEKCKNRTPATDVSLDNNNTPPRLCSNECLQVEH